MATYDTGDNFDIASIQRLEQSAEKLSSYNQNLTTKANSLEEIVTAIRNNWENEDGQDIQSILTNINNAIDKLSAQIQPIIVDFSEVLTTFAANTRSTQKKSY